MADYCTTANIKGAGRLNITDSGYDTQLGEIITAASRWIDRFCAGDIVNAFAVGTDTTRYYSQDNLQGGTLFLDAPLLAVTSITNGDSAAVASNTYRLWPRNAPYYYQVRLLSTADGWAFDTDGEIAIVGKWGLALSGSTPEPIKEACAMLAAWMFKRYQAALADATANFDLGQLVYNEAMPKQVVALLEPYRVGLFI